MAAVNPADNPLFPLMELKKIANEDMLIPYRNKENLDKNNKDEEQGIEDELEISSLIYDMECCK